MDTLTLINRAHQGDKLARDKILIENTGLIWSIVRRFLNRGHEGEDLFSIGCIGMSYQTSVTEKGVSVTAFEG